MITGKKPREEHPLATFETIQAFDIWRQENTYCFGLLDQRTGLFSINPAHEGCWTIEDVIDFLNGVWGNRPPKILAMDGGPPACHKKFKEFLAAKGIQHRCLDHRDAILRGRIEKAFRRVGMVSLPTQL